MLKTRHTPCKLLTHPDSSNLIVLEKDYRGFSKSELDSMMLEVGNKEQKSQEKKAVEVYWSKLGSYPLAKKD